MRLVAFGLVFGCLASVAVRWHNACADNRTPWAEILSGLESENLRYGYGSYENALFPMFYSQGRICIPHVSVSEGRLSLPGWCMAERWYDADSHDGATFLILTNDELARYAPKGLKVTALGEPRRLLKTGRFNVLVYDHNISRDLFGTMRSPVKHLWGFQEKWVSNGRAKMEVAIPEILRGREVDLELCVQSFGEKVMVFAGTECLGAFQFPESSADWTEKTVRFRVPARATESDRLALRFEATGVKSPKEHGWHDGKTKVGPRIVSATVTGVNRKEGDR